MTVEDSGQLDNTLIIFIWATTARAPKAPSKAPPNEIGVNQGVKEASPFCSR